MSAPALSLTLTTAPDLDATMDTQIPALAWQPPGRDAGNGSTTTATGPSPYGWNANTTHCTSSSTPPPLRQRRYAARSPQRSVMASKS